MLWLIIAISSYFLFAVVSLIDRYLLKGPPNPKIYTFYVGVLGISVLVLAPFVGFSAPNYFDIIFCLVCGAIYTFFLFSFFEGLERFEASRVVPAMVGFLPVFTFIFVYFLSGFKNVFGFKELFVFVLLILGGIIVSLDLSKKISFRSLKISVLMSLFLSLSFVLTKYIYLQLPFWTGFIWIRIGIFLTSLFFLFIKDVRREIFSGLSSFNKKTSLVFVINQGIGAGAVVLQNLAVALAALVNLSIINALQGIQYIFLFVLSLLFLKEERNRQAIIPKIIAILLIGAGLVILAF